MVTVMAARPVPLRTQSLNPLLLPPALKRARARFDAADGLCAWDHSNLGVADGLVAEGGSTAVMGDGRGLEKRLAKGRPRPRLVSCI